MTRPQITRRGLLQAGLATACSAAAHPWLNSVSFASAPWDARLVVIVLRGGMDGLDVVRPLGDPDYAGYRSGLLAEGAATGLDLDGYFALHKGLAALKPLWDAGELGFVHAVSTPYRNKRSHFDGQDILEAGSGTDGIDGTVRGGWLNRLVAGVPGTGAETAYAVGHDELKILQGRADVSRWAPDVDVSLTPQAELLLEHVYAGDPLFAPAAEAALALARDFDAEQLPDLDGGGKRDPVASFAAGRLVRDARIAAFSITGWDTHRAQGRGLTRTLGKLERAIRTLREDLGGVWGRTGVLAMTEFGRTVAENGTKGTDHGTGGLMVLAGGALRGGRVYGTWPGLDEAALFDRRDLMPTGDVRAYAAWAMRGLFGLDAGLLEDTVFPQLDMGGDPGIVA